MQLTKAKISIVSVSLFLAIIFTILFSLQNYSKIEFTASVDEEDDAGNRVMQSYHINGGLQDKYEYNYGADGSLTSIDKHDGSITYGYNATGQLISKKTVYGSSNSYRYNYKYVAAPYTSNNHVANLVSSSSFTVGVASSTYTYTYYPNGNLKSIKNPAGQTITYFYDEYDRLIREDSGERDVQHLYFYDNGGNIIKHDEHVLSSGEWIKQTLYYYDGVYKDQMTYYQYWTPESNVWTVVTLSYDGAGNPTSHKGTSLTWKNGRELASYGNGYASYTYDYSGLRTSRTITGGFTTHYLYEGSNLKAEITQYYTMWFYYDESGVSGFEHQGEKYIYEKNMLGDIVGIYRVSDGAYIGGYTYDAWGKILYISANLAVTNASVVTYLNPFRYRGYYFANESSLYYLNSRYYDPSTGRFLNADDPTALFDNASVAMGANLYAYCLNNPIMYTDSSGYGVFLDIIMSAVPGSYLSGIDYGEFVIPGVDPVLMHYIDSLLQVGLGIGMMFLPGAQYLGAGIIGAGVGGIIGGHISEAVGGTFSQGYAIGNFVGGFVGGGIKGIASGVKAMKFAKVSKLYPTHALTLSKRQFAALKNNIRTNGIKTPLEVVKFRGSRYVVNGNHRLMIANQLGITKVPVKYVKLPHLGYKTPFDLFW